MLDADLRAEALVTAKRSGLSTSDVVFSDKLEWIVEGGEPVLRKASVDRGSGKVILFVEAMRARWGGAGFAEKLLGVVGEAAATLARTGPQTLYVHRLLINADEVISWAKANGFATVLLPDDMHVTVAYSKRPLDWEGAGRSADIVDLKPTSTGRYVEQLGDEGAVVLRFDSPELAKRWQEFMGAGASWDYPSYKPHVTITYNGADVDPRKVRPYTGRLLFGPEIFAKITPVGEFAERAGWDEEDHPRDEDGKFTFSGGGANSGPSEQPSAEEIADALEAQQGESAQTKPAGKDPEPEVMEVGGDDWNRSTAARLEREYAEAYGKLEKIVAGSQGEEVEGGELDYDNAPVVPDEWDSLTDADQQTALEKYTSENEQYYKDSEVTNWEEEYKEDEARGKVAVDFTDGTSVDWLKEKLDTFIAEANDGGTTKIPFSSDEVLEAVTIKHETGNGSYKLDEHTEINIDDAKLLALLNSTQMTLPGIEPQSEAISGDTRDDLLDAVKDAFTTQVENVSDKMEPPDWIFDNVEEQISESWSNMESSEKFNFVKNNTSIIEDAQSVYDEWERSGGEVASVEVPNTFDPLQETNAGDDYRKTQALARYLSLRRAYEVMQERGTIGESDDSGDVRNEIRQLDTYLWSDWKSSSHSGSGAQLLQIAAAEEMGGRLRLEGGRQGSTVFDRDQLVELANKSYGSIGGYEGVKAYVRAKWETTQYMLDKAGKDTLMLYRGIRVPEAAEHEVEEVAAKHSEDASTIYKALPKTEVKRNGLVSTTPKLSVANGFAGSGGDEAVIIRFEVPRTAVLSVPAYGINVHSEQELVVLGTAYKGYDVWQGKAPTFSEVPMRKAAA